MGKSTNQMGMFTRFLRVYQRVCLHFEVHLEVTISLDGSTICPSGTSPCAGGFGSPYPHAWSIGSPGVGPLVKYIPWKLPWLSIGYVVFGDVDFGKCFFFFSGCISRYWSSQLQQNDKAPWIQGPWNLPKRHTNQYVLLLWLYTSTVSRFIQIDQPFVGRKPSSGWSNCMTGSMMIPLYPASLMKCCHVATSQKYEEFMLSHGSRWSLPHDFPPVWMYLNVWTLFLSQFFNVMNQPSGGDPT